MHQNVSYLWFIYDDHDKGSKNNHPNKIQHPRYTPPPQSLTAGSPKNDGFPSSESSFKKGTDFQVNHF